LLREIQDIHASLWISASAGTGKTKSLIDRILSLLLNGSIPSRILCLTYTKAAAVEMSERLNDYFINAAKMTDAGVIQELQDMGFSERYLKRMRELSQLVLQQDWVKIQTIHSFAYSIIQKFPLETGLLPGMKQCEDHEKTQLLMEAFCFVVKQPDLKSHLSIIARHTLSLTNILQDHTLMQLRKFFGRYSTQSDIKRLFSTYFNINIDDIDQPYEEVALKLKKELLNQDFRNCLSSAIKRLELSSKSTDCDTRSLLTQISNGNLDNMRKLIYTENGSLRARQLYTKDVESNELRNAIEKIKQDVDKYFEKKNILESANANISLFIVLNKIIQHFSENKIVKHIMDFDDIIIATIELLQNNIDWVMYKIDQSIDHVLVDEAQDTSPEQWKIIELITDDFFSVSNSQKTIFIVGDEKQSIYSFQGADVSLFNKMKSVFKDKAKGCGQKFYDINLNTSYRSDGAILKFVDDVFKTDFPNVHHVSSKNENKGVVEVISFSNDGVALPEYTAQLIADAIQRQLPVKNYARGAQPQDFLILFRHRDIETMNKICSELQKMHIPVSGIDRVPLKDELVVEDLVTLAQFVENPHDDLTCARVLKSPIISMSEDDLMNLCLSRQTETLWNYLLSDPKILSKYDIESLKRYTQLRLSTFSFFETILIDGVKDKLVHHFGGKSLMMINEFLNVCFNYEKEYSPLLSEFLRWFRHFDQTIKKEYNGSCNEVRLMTAHSSKGLQAPFVIIADAHFVSSKGMHILQDKENLFWNFNKKYLTNSVLQILKNQINLRNQESTRLLYVAMTRAESYLYILGNEDSKDGSWYKKIRKSSLLTPDESQNTEVNKFRYGEYDWREFPKIVEDVQHNDDMYIPDWYYQKFQIAEISEKQQEMDKYMLFGECVHALLSNVSTYREDLSLISDEIMIQFNLSHEDKSRALQMANQVYKKLPFLFNNSAKSEVTFFYNGKEGRIDHIVTVQNETWIIDWKSGTPDETIPEAYKEQLRLYQSAYENIKHIRARIAVVWVQNQTLIEIH